MARWIVTGCSTGIGREIAEAALIEGHQVTVTARAVASVADLADRFPGLALPAALDVTDKDQIAEVVRGTTDAFGGVDVLVNNAGYGYLSALEEGEDAEVRTLFDTNYFGVVDMVKAVLPGMRERRAGHIINISSMTGLVANPPNIYYSSSKFALEALTEGLDKEVRPLGIRVTAVEPGAVRTDWASRSMKESARRIADYDATVGVRRERVKAATEHMRGDPKKVAAAVVRIAGMSEPPLRLLLGRDVLEAFRGKLAEMTASIDEWEAVTTGIDREVEETR